MPVEAAAGEGDTTSAPPSKSAAPPADSAATFAGAMPKAEIGVLDFLKAHPEYDGRGVVVAIFDTGVDPGATGLQTTPDGRAKIIDILDGTGSGDVDMSMVQRLGDDRLDKNDKGDEGLLAGVWRSSKLCVNPDWKNPSGNWHVGAKRAFDLFPDGLKRRIKGERKKRFAEEQRAALTAATAAAAAAPKGATEADKKQRKELEDRVALLRELDEKAEDLGPWLECVVWHDGEHWRAAIDSSDLYAPGDGRGLLADFTPLTDFDVERQYATLSDEDALNFGVHIYDEGKVLCIVADAGSHGTHVAGITAAYHPDQPELNGMAPGAQIISCKIGDSRLGSMETITGLSRAIAAVVAHKADLINMSYGEATATPDVGRFMDLAAEVVHRQGVIFISSAGNAGPALSTAGAPGGTGSPLISIGAYVSADMALSAHSVRDAAGAGRNYNWSSRGPTADGERGVALSAPGGAIAPVPQWTMAARQLMNGTSMASPCAAGGVALVLSGLKATGQARRPNRVRRALENTATPLGGEAPDAKLTYGCGLLQVHKAFEYLEKSQEADTPDVRYVVRVRRPDGSTTGRGIYLREPLDTLHKLTFMADVRPTFHEDADVKSEKVAMEDRLTLRATAPWLSVPSALMLASNGRNFEIEVDASQLPEGLHYAEVTGEDSSAPWRGPLFRIPVTVVRPQTVATAAQGGDAIARLGKQAYSPGSESRRFIAVPEGATWAELRTFAGNHPTPRMFMLRAAQLLPHMRHTSLEKTAHAVLTGNARHTTTFKVVAGATLEITAAQFWSAAGDSELEQEVEFHGVTAEPASAFIDGSAGNVQLQLRAAVRPEKLRPSAKLEALLMPLRPVSAELTPLQGARDALPRGRTPHALTLTYKLNLLEGGKITPRLPMMNGYVYDGVLEAQFIMVHDVNKQLLGVADIYPEAIEVKKGDLTIRAMLRHDDPALLEKLRHQPLEVEKKVEAITVPVYGSNSDSLTGSNALKDKTLAPGERMAIFVGSVPDDKLPKDALPGRLLAGSVTLAKPDNGGSGGGGRPGAVFDASSIAPGAIPLSYLVPAKKEDHDKDAKEGDKDAKDEGAPDVKTRVDEAVRDAKVALLEELKTDSEGNSEAVAALEAELLEQYPQHLPLLTQRLARLEKVNQKDDNAFIQEIEPAADAVVAAIDTDALAKYLAQKCPEEGPGSAKRKKQFEEQKTALVAALAAKVKVLLDMEDFGTLAAAASQTAGPTPAAMEAAGEPAEAAKADGEAAEAAGEAAEGSQAADSGGSGTAEPKAPSDAIPGTEPPTEATQEKPAAAGVSEQKQPAEEDSIEKAFRELRKWVDTTDKEHAELHARREARAGRLASALRALEKSAPADETSKKEVTEVGITTATLYQRLGWEHWARAERSRKRKACPPGYPLF